MGKTSDRYGVPKSRFASLLEIYTGDPSSKGRFTLRREEALFSSEPSAISHVM